MNPPAHAYPPGSPDAIVESLRYGREYDWIGHHVATVLACIYLLLLPLATAPKDWAFGFLTLWTLIRLPHTWRSYRAIAGMPVLWATLAWVAWQAASFAWSSNLEQALDEFKVHRMLITPLLLWPILDRVPWLVMAALTGILAQNGVQAMQEIGWIATPAGSEGRLRGLIHPIHSAMWFGAAMMWHFSAMCDSRLRWRWRTAAFALLTVSAVGVLATGSRGPWIAAAAAFTAILIVVPLRRPGARLPALTVACACAVAVVAAWLASPTMIRSRLDDARSEITSATQRQEYWSSTGLRIGLWGWAIETWRTSPIIGIGAGDFAEEYLKLDSFKAASATALERSMIEEVPGYADAKAAGQDVTQIRGYRRGERLSLHRIDYIQRHHAHSTYLHTLSQQGVVGLALLLIVLGVIARQCWKDRPDHPYSDAMLFVLICWIVGAQFDCYELNGHQLGLVAFIAAATLPGRAKVRWRWSAIDPPIGESDAMNYDANAGARDACAAQPKTRAT